MFSLSPLIMFGAGFALTLLLLFLAISRLGKRKPRKSGRPRYASMARQAIAPQADAVPRRAERPKVAKPPLHMPMQREEIEQVFAHAEQAAVNSALGDLEADKNPHPANSRPGILWETQFNLVFMDWTGKARVKPMVPSGPVRIAKSRSSRRTA